MSGLAGGRGETLGTYSGRARSQSDQVDYIIIESSDPNATKHAIPSNYVRVDPTARILIVKMQPVL